jgi:hypothetical protein
MEAKPLKKPAPDMKSQSVLRKNKTRANLLIFISVKAQ